MSETSLTEFTASEILVHLNSGQLMAEEVCEAFLDRAEALQPVLHAFIRLDRGDALQDAATVDFRREEGVPVGLLAGLPVALKDNICTFGRPTTCGSKSLTDYIPPYDATVVAKLKGADAVLIGKTNLDEFAMGSSTEHSAFGVTRNPWDLEHVPGGSSGGSAAAVAAGLVPLALGSDTGGSVRLPASFCGVVGLKPTYGRVSRYGLVAYASSLDQIGPIGRTVEDVAILYQAIYGPDPRDTTSSPRTDSFEAVSVRKPLSGFTIGVIREHLQEGIDADVERCIRQAIKDLQALGATIRDISLPHARHGIATYYVIATSEASSNLARYDGAHYGYRTQSAGKDGKLSLGEMYTCSRSESLGVEPQKRIMLGTYALSAGYYDAYYLKALKVRRLIRDDFRQAFNEVDFLVGPVAPTPAYRIGELVDDPLAMYLGDLCTVTTNLAGIPAISIPAGFSSKGMPIGLQIQAPAFAEEALLQLAYMYQQYTDWHRRRPPI
jgi:aspartyl-tRNA(Asn)/glutamyl-tRNA(Gln) amidotransferase subunit A